MELREFDHHAQIEGTTIFDGRQAMKGYALNKMCYSFNGAAARDEFKADPESLLREIRPQRAAETGVPRMPMCSS
jgi:protocatechuate 4,5-dioxygenase alpha chain